MTFQPGLGLPTLQQPKDEGLVRAEDDEGHTPFTLTARRASVEENREELGEPWASRPRAYEQGEHSVRPSALGWSIA